jgi:hypothetical protein
MTAQMLYQRIVQANPGIQNRPDLVMKAMMKGQALLNPEGKQELAQQKMQLEYNAKIQKIQADAENAITRANSAQQVAEIRAAASEKVASIAQAAKLQGITINVEGAQKRTETNVEGAQKRIETNVAGREKVAETNAEAKKATGADQGIKAQRSNIKLQITNIQDKINKLFAGGRMQNDFNPAEKAQYDALVQQRESLIAQDGEIVKRAEKAGAGKQPALKDVEALGQAPGAAPNTGSPQAGGDMPPNDPKSLPEGTTASKGDTTYVVKGGQWVKQGGEGASPFSAVSAPGMVTPGNIDVHKRPVVKNADGTISTVRSITITNDKGQAILIPTVVGGKVVSNADAIAAYKRTGQHLGIFKDEDAADAYAEQLHEQQAKEYGDR